MADPRTDDTPESPNEKLQDRAIRHSLFIERLKTSEANKVKAQLERAYEDVVSQIEKRLSKIDARGFDTGPETTRRLQELRQGIKETLDPAYRETLSEQKESLLGIAQSEAQWQSGVVNQAVGVNLQMTLPDTNMMREVVSRRPFQGRLLSEWYNDLNVSHQTRLREAVRLGISEGQTTSQIVQRIRGTRAANYTDGVMEIGRRQAEAVTRTAISHTTNNARSELYKQNDNVVKQTQWVSTLDGRTTLICQSRDGKTYPVDSGPRPPAHFNCRSVMTPVLKSWRELGIDADELPESTRASMNGQVPESMTYNGWLRKQVNDGNMDVVEEALGAKRAKLFAAGGLDVSRFVDRRGRKLTLSELMKKEQDAFSAAGVEI